MHTAYGDIGIKFIFCDYFVFLRNLAQKSLSESGRFVETKTTALKKYPPIEINCTQKS